MKSTLYTLVVEDNRPTLREVDDAQVMVLGGKSYWVIPLEVIQHTPSTGSLVEASIRGYLDQGDVSIERITKHLDIPRSEVLRIMKEHGWEAPADKLRKKFVDALADAGDLGLPPHRLSDIAGPNARPGPILMGMLRRREIRRLNNGNWAVAV